MKKKEYAIATTLAGEFRVRVMARAEGYAMVRRPNATPFIVSETHLKPMEDADETQEMEP